MLFTSLFVLSSIAASVASSNPHEFRSSRLGHAIPPKTSNKRMTKRSKNVLNKRDLNGYKDLVGTGNSIPLKRTQSSIQSGVHPQVLLQQHINRATRKLVNMKKSSIEGDLDQHLEGEMRKRWIDVHGHDQDLKLNKRGGPRWGHPMADKVANTGSNAKTNEEVVKGQSQSGGILDSILGAFGGGNGRKGSKGGSQSQSQTGTGAGTGNGTSSSSSNTGPGFSEVALQAGDNVTPPGNPTANDSVGLAIEGADIGYLATLSLGTPPQDFLILMDTGSADFWVPSQGCTQCGNHQTLGAKTSSTFKATNEPFQVTYGSGDVAGNKVLDTVTLAGLTVSNLTFGTTTQESSDFTGAPFDGLMGTALSILSSQQVPTFIETLANQGSIQTAVVGYRLSNVQDGANESEMTLGGVDSSKFSGSLTTVDNVSQQGFFQAAVDDVQVNGQSIGINGISGILDTGTTLMVMPTAIADAVHAGIEGAQPDGNGGFTLPCTTTAILSMTIGGTQFDLKARDLLFQPVDPNNLTGDCVSSISAGNIVDNSTMLLGDAFLNEFYYVTDATNNKISLANAA